MPEKFDHDMSALKNRLLEMGAIAEEMVEKTISAIVKRDNDLIDQVRSSEKQMDGFQNAIDEETVRLIAVYTPVASDLRQLLMTTRMNAELERIGDQANNICKTVQRMIEQPSLKPLVDLPKMADIVKQMVHDSLTAFIENSSDKALGVIKTDDRVDDLHNEIFKELLGYITGNNEQTDSALRLILISKAFERIGDHAVNMSEDVVYMVKGKDIRHKDISR